MAKSTRAVKDKATQGATQSLRERAAGTDPVFLAAGAAVAGAVVGAFVPRSATEARLLAPLGKHVTSAAGALGTVARQALSAELAGVPVVGQIAANQIERVLDSVVPAVVPEPAVTPEPESDAELDRDDAFEDEPASSVRAD